MELTYSGYLQLQRLLDLQQPRSQPPEHDEMLFIIAHQTYELWFKQLLHEFDTVKEYLRGGKLYESIATFQRCRTILKVLTAQVDIVETMTPMSFSSFRDRLDRASGFQSVQFRELEFVLGYKRPEMLRFHKAGSPEYLELQRRLSEPTVVDAFYNFLAQHGVESASKLQSASQEPATGNDQVAEGVLALYKTRPDLVILFELMTDFDEGFQEWRYRHIKLVERSIGSKQGTGGSLGVEFLKQSLFRPLFADLWTIRHRL